MSGPSIRAICSHFYRRLTKRIVMRLYLREFHQRMRFVGGKGELHI